MSDDQLLARDITAEDKADYLRLIQEGANPAQAAHELGSTGTQFRRLRNPMSEWYDAEFADAFRAAITSEAHEQNRLERIRDLVWRLAEKGDSKMVEKLALIYDPDWSTLRHQNLNVNVRMLARALPYFTTEELERAWAAAAEMEKNEHPILELTAPKADAA